MPRAKNISEWFSSSEDNTDDAIIDNNEERDEWDYPSITERRLHVGPLVQRIGSFYPSKRQGYSESRTENAIRRRNAREIYDNRIIIAQSIAESRFTDKDDVLTHALVSSHIAPNSVDGWTDYIIMIADREGGWDIFLKKLRSQLDDLKSYQKSIIKGWVIAFSVSVLALVLTVVLGNYLPDSWFNYLVYGVIIGISGFSIVKYGILNAQDNKPKIRSITGPAVRDLDAFISADKVKAISRN